MATTIIFHSWHLFSTFFFLSFICLFTTSASSISSSSSSYHLHQRHLLQSNSHNIETFFPFSLPETKQPPQNTQPPPPSYSNTPISPSPSEILQPQTQPRASNSVVKAVFATAASTFVVAGVFFFFIQRHTLRRRRDLSDKTDMSSHRQDGSFDSFKLLHGNLKGLIVDENGLDVLYWRKLQSARGEVKKELRKEVLGARLDGEERASGQAAPNLNYHHGVGIHSSSGKLSSGVSPEPRDRTRYSSPASSNNSNSSSKIRSELGVPHRVFSLHSAESSSSTSRIQPELETRYLNQISSPASMVATTHAMAMARPGTQVPVPPPPLKSGPPPPPHPVTAFNKTPASPPPPPPVTAFNKTPAPPPPPPPVTAFNKTPAPPPPPPPVTAFNKTPAPPPPPPPVTAFNKTPAPPPPPPPAIKKNPVPPPPPPRAGGLKPPPPPATSSASKGKRTMSEPPPMDSSVGNAGQMKLKPLHWDKVVANTDHSMVWDKIGSGSFRFDDDMIEALFGYVATNRKSDVNKNAEDTSKPNLNNPTQICLLDPHKSQNIAIVLRSLSLSRQEILDALLNGSGLNAETVEKLTKIAPTKEEEELILEFSGNPSKLADAESFLYHLLGTVPSPFLRLDAMLFKTIYDSEILYLKESLQTLESACQELRRRGLFLKLLEAILKAGNRMNAGTARGNAQAFNLTALRKLSDVKSTDGKTTLLHFVVEEVVRSEGKRCVINRNYSLGHNNSNSSPNSVVGKKERDNEYMILGLPVVGGLSVEFSNVKKAATIDYEGFIHSCSALTARVNVIRQFLGGQNLGRGDGFVREMKGFLEAAEEELKLVREEEVRVMEIVKNTTEYYQAGASKDKGANPLQLFVIIKDFLGMVDQVCIDIARSQQQKKKPPAGMGGSSPPRAPITRIPVRFPNLPTHFMSDHSKTSSSSSDSDDDF